MTNQDRRIVYMTTAQEQETAERRHLEMMAATIAAGLPCYSQMRYGGLGGFGVLVEDAVTLARAIQEEVRRDAK